MPIGPAPLKTRMGVRPLPQVRSEKHRAWVRRQPCICKNIVINGWSSPCGGPVQAAHFRSGNGGGMGLRPCDMWTFPACHGHHMTQHSIGEAEFQRAYKIDLREICISLARRSPDERIRDKAL